MIDWRSFPPLSALRAFLAFAEAETLDQAGARIGVTHAAISQQIRSLEAHLGLALVDRGGRRLALTADGRRLANRWPQALARSARPSPPSPAPMKPPRCASPPRPASRRAG